MYSIKSKVGGIEMTCPNCGGGYQLKEGKTWFCGECEISYDEYGNRSDIEHTVPTPEEFEEESK